MASTLPTYVARLTPAELAALDRVLELARQQTGLRLSRSDLLRLAIPLLQRHFDPDRKPARE